MDKEDAIQAYRGTILSDGSLKLNGRNACFNMALSDNRENLVQREKIPVEALLEFLQHFVIEVLEPLGIEPCSGYPRIESHIGKNKKGEWIPGVYLVTLTSELNTELYCEYYPNGKKTIPEGFTLTDIFLAWFFMLDGNSKWDLYGGPGVDASLFMQGYDLHSVELFEEQLRYSNISTGRAHDRRIKSGAGIWIKVPRGSTDHFMKRIDPHVISPYRYKIKYRGSCPPELAKRYKEYYEEYSRNKYGELGSVEREHYNEYYRKHYGRRNKSQTQEDIDNLRAKIGKEN